MAKDLDPTGAPAALQSFKELSGRWINGYAGGNPDKWANTVEQVLIDCQNMGYIAKAYPDYTFLPESEQKQIVDESAKIVREDLIQYILENKEEILRTRKENGVEGKY
jgi:hypothetical protein